ncbi:MAG TPA: hypothetical protein VEX38_00240, partial [Fimbriimonadaceae bacterium]|nr:hypothetical protein [Fimbriimonadaceae bacterium]
MTLIAAALLLSSAALQESGATPAPPQSLGAYTLLGKKVEAKAPFEWESRPGRFLDFEESRYAVADGGDFSQRSVGSWTELPQRLASARARQT